MPQGGSDNDYFTSSLLSNGTPLIEDHFKYSREQNAKWIVLESWSDWKEGTAWYRSDHGEWAYPNQHLALVREYADRTTKSLVFEAEACDFFYDKSYKNSGGEYRYHWHTNGIPDIDVYRPMHLLSDAKQFGQAGKTIRQLSVGFHDVWAITEEKRLISCEVDGSPYGWKDVNYQKEFVDLSMGRLYVWGIGTDGKTWFTTLKEGQELVQRSIPRVLPEPCYRNQMRSRVVPSR